MFVVGATRREAVKGSSVNTNGAGSRMEGLLRIGEPSGDAVRVRPIFGDFSARGILLGDAIFEGCRSRDNYSHVNSSIP